MGCNLRGRSLSDIKENFIKTTTARMKTSATFLDRINPAYSGNWIVLSKRVRGRLISQKMKSAIAE
jgi:hypothetical protein